MKCFRFLRRICRDREAFSILEMLIVGVIFAAVLGMICETFMTGSNVQETSMAQASLDDHARRVVKMIADEMQMAIHNTGNQLDPVPPELDSLGSDTVSFQISEGFNQGTGEIIPSNTIRIQFTPPDTIERIEWDDFGVPHTSILTHWVMYNPATLESGLMLNFEDGELMIVLVLGKTDSKGRRLESFGFAKVRIRNAVDT